MRDAADRRTGVAAFNVITLEHAEGIVAGAVRAARPVILQVSQNAVRFHDGAIRPLAAALRAVADEAGVDVSLHLDHVEDVDLVRRAPDAGYSSVMVDAGALPYSDNASLTAEQTRWLHEQGLAVEAEPGLRRRQGQPAAERPRARRPHRPRAGRGVRGRDRRRRARRRRRRLARHDLADRAGSTST
ncbi:hypothetical protein GCM10025868_32300 [Angustibacter aerolatus]|uniref:Fructose-bisphosphate aldolase n=1 Tax=Angustibacter aerolatus TaxID=1162965 RepID=A0ABQ6JL47_9ACTN|nr:class II fructose-bisphosphate aldolase [Angustibacter aerolatus]GMA87980.1 hypothetical protein GCM10025868_32300 [Angustibacter aerolatus]